MAYQLFKVNQHMQIPILGVLARKVLRGNNLLYIQISPEKRRSQ